jgi:hypothetical protein
MKKSTKLFIILLITGAAGLALMMIAAVASGAIYSREASESYTFDETQEAITLHIDQARVELAPSDECCVEAYVKAWRPDEIDLDSVLAVRMEGGVLKVEETGFPADFLGLFPQPYEMKLTIYAPQAVLDTVEGGVS